MLKLIRMEAAQVRYEIAATLMMVVLVGAAAFNSEAAWRRLPWLLLILLLWMCRGFHRMIGQSVSGEDSVLTQMLPVPQDRLMASKAVVCGLWTSGTLTGIVVMYAAFFRLETYYEMTGLRYMTLWLMARGLSALETALAMGLLPAVFYSLGWFTGITVLAAHVKWGGRFEARRCGPLLTVLAMATAICVIGAVFFGADRLTAWIPWSLGCYMAALALLAGCGWMVQRCWKKFLKSI